MARVGERRGGHDGAARPGDLALVDGAPGLAAVVCAEQGPIAVGVANVLLPALFVAPVTSDDVMAVHEM
ncbi:hypothetical protein caldi_30640 [Caldinitratiruptor microaerophilus]|uniref:Uncharacterized protein n=1 Tax=Caldinitratiruptor microaerophilus TaxID=671077 RepID=A0AA35CNV7_9FIRM|nr:hypothetical protein caldi_30640 [Caldinitratiruptor microaerophilus]